MQEYVNQKPEALWLSVSPYLKGFDQRLLSHLTGTALVRRWEYYQTVDEPCCVEDVVESLHEYITNRAAEQAANSGEDRPIHLLGHGVSGTLALLYARRYPQHVASLTLLSVSSQPAVNWPAHYYALRQLLPCSQQMILTHMARLLFGDRPTRFATALAQLLERELDSSLTFHSLARRTEIVAGGVEVPLLVCSGEADFIANQRPTSWQAWQKAGDRVWICPNSNHFFHFHHPNATATAIAAYWQKLNLTQKSASLHPILAPHSRL